MELDFAVESWVRKMEKYAGDDLEMIFKIFPIILLLNYFFNYLKILLINHHSKLLFAEQSIHAVRWT